MDRYRRSCRVRVLTGDFRRPRPSWLWMTMPRAPTVAFAVRAPIARADLPGLCDRVCALLQAKGAGVAEVDVGGVVPDAVTVDALARLHVAAGRYGCHIRMRRASAELRELVAFMGLGDVLSSDPTPGAGAAGPTAGTGSPSRGRR